MKKVALIDNEKFLDNKKVFPNYALMKISTFYKNKGYEVEWFNPLYSEQYEKVFFSKVFTFSDVCDEYDYVDKDKLIVGGTGVNANIKLYDEIDKCFPDYTIYDVDYAVGFLTRGCNNHCKWCIVPTKEGKVHKYQDINKLLRVDANKILLLDNNILQYSNHLEVLESLTKVNCKIDFNQGIDIRMINKENVKVLAKINWIKYIRFSCDDLSQIEYFSKNLKLLKECAIAESKIFIYLLVQDVSDAEERVDFFRENFNKVTIYAQPYRDFKNKVVITEEQKEFSWRYIYKGLWRKESYREYLEKRKNYGRIKV